jgi:hypothetical protein
LVRRGAYLGKTESHQGLEHFYAGCQIWCAVVQTRQKVAMEIDVLRHGSLGADHSGSCPGWLLFSQQAGQERKRRNIDDWGLREREHRLQIQPPGGKDSMGDKVALPSLSLPKQRTHWSVGVVIAATVLLIILGAALYAVLQRQQAAEEAYAKREADRAALVKAETEKAKAEAERAVAETKKKEAEAAASNAATAQSKAAQANNTGDDAAKKANKKKSAKKGSSSSPKVTATGPGPATPAPAPPKQTSKASKDIDDLLRGFK